MCVRRSRAVRCMYPARIGLWVWMWFGMDAEERRATVLQWSRSKTLQSPVWGFRLDKRRWCILPLDDDGQQFRALEDGQHPSPPCDRVFCDYLLRRALGAQGDGIVNDSADGADRYEPGRSQLPVEEEEDLLANTLVARDMPVVQEAEPWHLDRRRNPLAVQIKKPCWNTRPLASPTSSGLRHIALATLSHQKPMKTRSDRQKLGRPDHRACSLHRNCTLLQQNRSGFAFSSSDGVGATLPKFGDYCRPSLAVMVLDPSVCPSGAVPARANRSLTDAYVMAP